MKKLLRGTFAIALLTLAFIALHQISPEQQSTVTEQSGNLFENPGFDQGEAYSRQFTELRVYPGWYPFWQIGDPPRICGQVDGQCVEPGTPLKRPEWKPADMPWFAQGETGQQWFCFWGPCNAGIYQRIPTTRGQYCEVSARVGTYNSEDWDGQSDGDGELDNSQWYIKVDPYGLTDPFAGHVLSSRAFLGGYDTTMIISFGFTAQSDIATVYFGNLRPYNYRYQDSIVYDAYAFCGGRPSSYATAVPLPTATPVPPSTNNAGVTVAPTATPVVVEEEETSSAPVFVADGSLGSIYYFGYARVRDCSSALGSGDWFSSANPVNDCSIVKTFKPGDVAPVFSFQEDAHGNVWAWHTANGSLTSAVCYGGRGVARFYRDLPPEEVEAIYGGERAIIPRAESPCSTINLP